MSDSIYQDNFGLLPLSKAIELPFGKIIPVENYQEILEWIKASQHRDGFLYPPMSKSVNVEPFSGKILEEIPNTKRPAHLYKLPISHRLQINMSGDKQEIRTTVGGLIIYLLSYLFGTRLQFEDWWVDGRIPIKSTHNITLQDTTIEQFIAHTYTTWQSWPNSIQYLFINILYMNARVPSYEWIWEQFTINYMVFDACFKLTTELHGTKQKIRHDERFKFMCQTYNLFFDNEHIEAIYGLRNQLFHEALWNDSLPGMGEGRESFYHTHNLRRLNQRLIPALVGYQTQYIQSSWLSISNHLF